MAKTKSKSIKQRKFSLNHLVVTAVVFGLVGGAIGWAAFAAPHNGGKGGGSNGSISLVLSTDVNGDGLPNWGDTVTYSVSTTATSAPSVKTVCTQNGSVVLHSESSFYAGNPFAYTNYVPLKSDVWTSGAADCTATMFYNSHKQQVTLATISYHVNA
jgi:hypothetical protein